MSAMTRPAIGRPPWPTRPPAAHPGRTPQIERESRQFRRMVAIGFLVLLVPAAIGRMTGWRWRPWPPGQSGYRSVIEEAREAAETYILFSFLGW